MTLLQAASVVVNYGIVPAVRGVSIEVGAGQVTTVLGANGAGKTSLLSAISGVVRISAGSVLLKGEEIAGQSVSTNVRRGLVHVPEGRRIISPLTVEENLLLGGFTRSAKQNRQRLLEIYDTFPILADRRRSAGGLLSGGEQQMLAFGRALMADPELLLLDEPSMGLAPVIIDVIMESVQSMAQRGIGILMVEQNATEALDVASYAYVIEQGRVVLKGSADELSRNAGVLKAYLGLEELSDEAAVHGNSPERAVE